LDKLGIHAFVWTGSSVQADLEAAIEKSHQLGYRLIEFPRLNPAKFDVPALAARLRERGMAIAVTMGAAAGRGHLQRGRGQGAPR
jgi:D-psicose/D-tagatose/L-ribulose 3-epimerase